MKTRAIDARTAQLREEAYAKLAMLGVMPTEETAAPAQKGDQVASVERSNVIPFRKRAR